MQIQSEKWILEFFEVAPAEDEEESPFQKGGEDLGNTFSFGEE